MKIHKKRWNTGRKQLRLSPEDNKIHHRLALGFKRLGQIDKSIMEEQIALKIDPEMQEALIGLAETLISLNKPSGSIKLFAKKFGIGSSKTQRQHIKWAMPI